MMFRQFSLQNIYVYIDSAPTENDWDFLDHMTQQVDIPLLCVGDFNDRHFSEDIGDGNRISLNKLE